MCGYDCDRGFVSCHLEFYDVVSRDKIKGITNLRLIICNTE